MKEIYYACSDNGNFGDLLNKWLAEKISGKDYQFGWNKNVMISGSILSEAIEDSTIMGCGFQDCLQTTKSKKIGYVRGWMTKAILRINKIENYAKVFEPAFCLREFFEDRKPTEKLGYIPHYVDNETHYDGAKKIDICSGIENVINEVLDCAAIITSSLHGLVISDLFGRKTCLINPINKINGDGIKFLDYWSFIDAKPYGILDIKDCDGIEKRLWCEPYSFNLKKEAINYINDLKRVLK
jgi:pyruvyltransferase